MATRRGLTAAEIALAKEAFASTVDYRRVRVSDGADCNPVALTAFAKGNPAITLRSTLYFRRGYAPDFGAAGADCNAFIHEMAHVWQFQRLGVVPFLLRYAREFAAAGGKAGRMYDYPARRAAFAAETLEAQAQMAGHYAAALRAQDARTLADLAARLAGSGLYGL